MVANDPHVLPSPDIHPGAQPGTHPATTPGSTARRGHRDLVLSWVFLALSPVAAVAAMVLGEGLATALGMDGADPPRLGDMITAGGPAILLGIAPAAIAALFGYRATRHGEPRGRIPALIAAAVVLYWLITPIPAVLASLFG